MKKNALWLIIIVALQVGWMFAVAISKEAHLESGRTVLLETLPVDPRDLLRGDYVVLRYKISNVPTNLFWALPPGVTNATQAALAGRTIYVGLTPHDGFHEVSVVSFTPIEAPNSDLLFIKGQVTPDSWLFSPATVHVSYGIEQYFVPEGTGNPRGKVTVRVALDKDGAALIKEVLVDGKPYAEALRAQRIGRP